MIGISAFLFGHLPGCAGSGGDPPPLAEGGLTGDTTGMWRNVDAAISRIAERFELAVLNEFDADPLRRRYELISRIDEPVVIEVSRESDIGIRADGPLHVTVQYGQFGNTEKEARIRDAMLDRLAMLSRLY